MPRGLFVRLSLLLFVQFFVWGTWYVTAGVYLRNSLHFSGKEIGLVYASPGIAAMIMPFFIGRLADKYFPIEKMLAGLHLLSGLTLYFASQAISFNIFFPLILLNALCYQPTMSLAISMCFYHQKQGMGKFPKIRLWGTLGWIVGGILVSLFAWESTETPLKVCAWVSFGLAFYCLSLPSAQPLGKNTDRLDVLNLIKNKSLVYVMTAMLFIMIPASFYYSFVNPFLVDMAIKYPAAKMSYGQVSEILVLLVLPFIMTKLSWRKIMFIGFFVWGARYLLFLLPNNFNEIQYGVGLALHGIAYCFSALTAQIYVNHISRPEMRSTAQGAYSFVVMGLGTMLGSFIAGHVVDYATSTITGETNWDYVWTFAGCFGILSSMIFLATSKGRFETT